MHAYTLCALPWLIMIIPQRVLAHEWCWSGHPVQSRKITVLLQARLSIYLIIDSNLPG